MLLTGKYEHQIDAKNRIRIPTKLKGNEDKVYFPREPTDVFLCSLKIMYRKKLQF